MKICYIGNATSGHIKRWVNWFAGKGYEIHLITDKPAKIDGVIVHQISNNKRHNLLNFFIKAFQTKKIVKEVKPDLLHAHYAFGYGTFGTIATFHPCIISCWGSDISLYPGVSKFAKPVVKYSLRKADVVHVGDIYSKEKVVELGIKRDKIFIQLWGIDLNLFNPGKYSVALRKELNVKKYMVLCVRAWEPKFNVDVLIRAIPHVLQEVDDITFVLIRGGSLENKLKDLAKKLGVEQHIVFIGRAVSYNEMPEYYASSDVLVKPYSAEKAGGGIGVATMEAMACGTPLIIPEKAYLIKQGKSLNDEPWFCGLTYEYKNPKDLGNKIIQLIKNGKIKKEIGVKEREIAKKIGDFDKNMKVL